MNFASTDADVSLTSCTMLFAMLYKRKKKYFLSCHAVLFKPGMSRQLLLKTISALLKKKARGVLGLRDVTAQGVLWQHTRVLS